MKTTKMMALVHKSLQRKHPLQQYYRAGSCCWMSSLSSLVDSSDTNINSNANTNNSIARQRISVAPGALPPALSRTNYPSKQQKQQQQQRRSFGSTSLVPLCSYSYSSYPSSSQSHSNSSSLLAPTVVYSDNHLLAINKPAGWHSVPNISKKRGRISNNQSHKNGNSNENDNRGAEHTTTTATTTIGSSSSINKKCLLTHLQTKGLGGGSNKDFLLPLHRIDQPCTGILLFGKTSKAASRITTVWKGKKKKKKKNNNNNTQQQAVVRDGVVKDYLCVVPTSRIAAMEEVSVPVSVSLERDDTDTNDDDDDNLWNRLDGLMLRQSATSSASELHGMRTGTHLRWQQQKYYNERRRKGKSVRIVRPGRKKAAGANEPQKHDDDDDDKFYDYDHEVDNSMMRPVSVRWKILYVPNIEPGYTLLLVRTSEGARHMVRALLAQVGDCPIIGDLRYWTAPKRMTINSSNSNVLLPSDRYSDGVVVHDDQAAATAARSSNSHSTTPNEKDPLKDRSVALHAYGVYFDPQQLQLGTLDTFEFRAPVPSTWKSFFGIDNAEINNIL